MAATGFTPISNYYSATTTNVPTAGNLVAGELALNTADGKLFYKDSSGVVQVIAGKGGAGVAGGSTTQVQYNSSGSLAGSANMTFSGTALTLANDASISGLTVGKGASSVASNTVVGANSALSSNTTGTWNTAIGSNALQLNSSGNGNTGLGYLALQVNSTGSYNTAVGGRDVNGYSALPNNSTGSYNVAVGNAALGNSTTANNNVAVGFQAGYNHTVGAGGTFIGFQAGYGETTGTNNTCLGNASGYGVITLSTGTNNVYIGYGASGSAGTNTNEIVIGGNVPTGKGSNTGFISPNAGGVYQGNNSAAWSITSDARLKKNIVDNTTGLNAISQIQVRNFEYRTADEVTELPVSSAIDIKGIQLGAIAQELQAILPDCVKTESTGVMSVDTTNLTWYLINAVKELNAKITALENK